MNIISYFENKWEINIVDMLYNINYYRINRVYSIRIDQKDKQSDRMK